MRTASLALVVGALVAQYLALWRAGRAISHRDDEPADLNDVVFVIALVGCNVLLGLLAVVLAALSL